MDDSELAETAVAHGGERREGAGAAGQSAALGDYGPVSVAAGLPSVYAALDLGTNNCRLLVARRAGDAFRVVDAFSRIVRLGEGLENSGRLSEAAMDRTVAALAVCMRKLRYRRVERLRAIATEACRRAENGTVFLDRVRQETGLDLEVITTAEEAELAYHGCAPLFEPERPHVLVLDIGGGSTEVCWLERDKGEAIGRLRRSLSLPFGVVTLAERHGGRDVSEMVYRRMMAQVTEALHSFDPKGELLALAQAGALQLVGTSGTVTTLAGVHLDLPRYQRDRVDGLHLSRETVLQTSRLVRELDFPARAAHPCIGIQRADLVVAGCAIVEAVLELWPLTRLRVADRGLREGMLTRMIHEDLSRAGAA
ncbi:Ppx/GppA phosphatase family protein [Aquibaculum sediminis]|uniref:Ppx/GppA phosphatase family protein n=1 Tax=Aquibaculum sediminis TaxID=3231907 RepID=UPI0034538292